jgi:glycine/D-amino acid oxidase-like deaminating enzyme
VTYDALVVGGGFYGARLAALLRTTGRSVMLVEREPALLARASLRNQARVHNGYHYPRSLLTALRSRLNYDRFLNEYADCVDRSFPHYYAIARGASKVTQTQFAEFCRRIGAPLLSAPAAVKRLFDSSRIDAVFEVQECAFDADRLRSRVTRELRDAGVDVALETEAMRVRDGLGGPMRVVTVGRSGEQEIETGLVFNCTYSRLNRLLHQSNAPIIPAKHELTEMALVEPPRELAGAAVTVMDGPFFSLMPYPSRGLFTLSHVRYTPHASWQERQGDDVSDGDARLATRTTRFTHMVRDAQRYLPVMSGSRYVDSVWEVKTVMPRSEQDDSRPILLQRSTTHPNCFTVLGAKIDSVYDVEEALTETLGLAAPPVSRPAAQPKSPAVTTPRSSESLISIVAPLESDSTPATVEAFVDETVAVLRGIVTHYEIVLVDDGAPAETTERVRALLARHDFVRFLRLSRHFGEETAISAGLDVAIGDYIIVMLPNMDPPALIPEFYERARAEADIVYGVRLHRKAEPLWYRAGARLFYWYMNSVVGVGIPEDSTQFRCMTRQVVNAIAQIRGPDQYLRLLTSYIGFRKQGFPYAPINRTGQPTVRPKADAAHLARALIIDHTTHPLRLVLRGGMLAAGVNAAWVALRPGVGGQSLWSALALFLITTMIGTTGEYVGALARRMRDRPAYYVREEHTSSVLLREERKNVVDATRDGP